ncbi:MAG: insulinase family protein [Hyphomicrobium sp.]|jgi:zinc protease|nr:insulinase family protein [Hyphomicrobium sp.]
MDKLRSACLDQLRFGVRVARSGAAILPVLALALCLSFTRPAHAMKIQEIKSPGGIEAWLVEAHENPLLALKFSFEGGNAQDPAGKDGVANFLTAMLDEGAGDLTSSDFQEQMETLAMRMSYEDSRDAFYGNFETLTQNRDEAVKLLKLAITKPRFDADAVERIRSQLLANLVYADRSPDKVAAREWFATAFAGHVYARPSQGTEATVGAITSADLEAFRKRTFARSNLKVVAVGDISPEQLGKLLDDVFGDLPANPDLVPVPMTTPVAGTEKRITMDVPQSVAVFGLPAMARKDPDFMPAFVINHLVGGGGFASRLMEEVRERRGLAYSVYSYLQPFRHTSILMGSVATRADAINQSLDVIRAELKQVAEEGPKPEEFENAKKYLIGSYALRFDTNAKIASQLLGLLEDDFGPEYIENRNKMIEAITLDDAKRVAKRLLAPENLIITIVGQPATAAAASDKKG